MEKKELGGVSLQRDEAIRFLQAALLADNLIKEGDRVDGYTVDDDGTLRVRVRWDAEANA